MTSRSVRRHRVLLIAIALLAGVLTGTWYAYSQKCRTLEFPGSVRDCAGSGGCCRYGYLGYYIN